MEGSLSIAPLNRAGTRNPDLTVALQAAILETVTQVQLTREDPLPSIHKATAVNVPIVLLPILLLREVLKVTPLPAEDHTPADLIPAVAEVTVAEGAEVFPAADDK
jgi:hypothetical protein